MNRIIKLLLASLTSAVLFGCAHPISMKPDLTSLKSQGSPIEKQVGYYMADTSKALEVTTPGGGGDKVRYFPYRDIEPGFYKALSEVFSNVSKIKNAKDLDEVSKSGISLLIVPEITTTSSSPSPFTWPPTLFSVTLSCSITDATGQSIRTFSVTGNGNAEFDEFKKNFSLASERATNDALSKLIVALQEAPELRK